MIYLTRLNLNGRDRLVRRDLADCRQMHRTVMKAFPQAAHGAMTRDAFGALYRLETDARGGIRLLVQSTAEPSWSHLPAGYLDGAAATENPRVKEVGSLYDGLCAGQQLRFRLRANPTKRVGASGGETWAGKRVGLRAEGEQFAWLTRKGEAAGFNVVSVRSAPDAPDVRRVPGGVVRGRREQTVMTFESVTFDGLLCVTDAAAFRETLRVGVGSGKAYGFGLLSIAPA